MLRNKGEIHLFFTDFAFSALVRAQFQHTRGITMSQQEEAFLPGLIPADPIEPLQQSLLLEIPGNPKLTGEVFCEIRREVIPRQTAFYDVLGGNLEKAPQTCAGGICKSPCFG